MQAVSREEQFKEITFTFKKLKTLQKRGPIVDCLAPTTLRFSDKISRHRKLKLAGAEETHKRNIEIMQRRICEYASVIDM